MRDTNQQEVSQSQTGGESPRLLLIAGGAVYLVVITALFCWQWIAAIAELNQWRLVEAELQYALPAWSEVVRTVSPFMFCGIGLVCGIVALIALSWRSRGYLWFAVWCGIVTLVVAAASSGVLYSTRSMDAWLARLGEIDLPLSSERVDVELAKAENPDLTREDKRWALRTIRFIGLKHAAGLVHVKQPQIDHMCAIARDEEQTPFVRFLTAWAMMPIDHRSDAACHAIRESFAAAMESEDEELREFAQQFKGHPCLVSSEATDNAP